MFKESMKKIYHIENLEFILMFITLVILLLEAKFIFIPAEKQIDQSLFILEENQRNLNKIFHVAPTGMILVDFDNFIIEKINKIGSELIGSEKNLIGKPVNIIFDRCIDFDTNIKKSLLNNEQISNMEITIHRDDEQSNVYLLSASKVFVMNKLMIVLGLSDISSQKKAEDILRHHASIDEMTGLLNRRTGILLLEKEIERFKSMSFDLTLCFIDLDKLKSVNDVHGHHEGDWFIKEISKTLLNYIRNTDIAFRYGGDELIIVLNQCNLKEAKIILSRITEHIESINHSKLKPYTISISYGFAEYKSYNCKSVEEFINHADEEMYRMKKAKKAD